MTPMDDLLAQAREAGKAGDCTPPAGLPAVAVDPYVRECTGCGKRAGSRTARTRSVRQYNLGRRDGYVQGVRDALADPERLRAILPELGATLTWDAVARKAGAR